MLQMVAIVTFCVLMSENVAVAVNCCPNPSANDGLIGEIVREQTARSGMTVSVAPVRFRTLKSDGGHFLTLRPRRQHPFPFAVKDLTLHSIGEGLASGRASYLRV